MKFLSETHFEYAHPTLFVLAFFYGIYFTKQILQKRKGIKTRQIGQRKEKDIHTVELFMSIATVGTPAAQLLSVIFGWNHMPENVRFDGFCVGILGDVIFLLAVIFMKDSWRAGIPDKDKTELVTSGIYRYSRNPAFLGFDLMYIGVLLMYGNVLNFLFSAFAAVMLHLQILQEEKYLEGFFGADYTEYKKQVFRYFGRKRVFKP